MLTSKKDSMSRGILAFSNVKNGGVVLDIIDRIIALIEERGITASRMLLDLGLSRSAVTEWEKGKAKPSAESIIKIADYFNVSSDYLLGRSEPYSSTINGNILKSAVAQGAGSVDINNPEKQEMTDEEIEMLRIFRILDLKRKIQVLNLLFSLEEEKENSKQSRV